MYYSKSWKCPERIKNGFGWCGTVFLTKIKCVKGYSYGLLSLLFPWVLTGKWMMSVVVKIVCPPF